MLETAKMMEKIDKTLQHQRRLIINNAYKSPSTGHLPLKAAFEFQNTISKTSRDLRSHANPSSALQIPDNFKRKDWNLVKKGTLLSTKNCRKSKEHSRSIKKKKRVYSQAELHRGQGIMNQTKNSCFDILPVNHFDYLRIDNHL